CCPTVNAAALMARADSAARASVCIRTWLKSWPNRGSKKLRVAISSGWPGERANPSKIDVASEECELKEDDRIVRCPDAPWRFFVHSAHEPLYPADPPQLHFRCSRAVGSALTVRVELAFFLARRTAFTG